MGDTYHNVASGNANVGAQIGHVTGKVTGPFFGQANDSDPSGTSVDEVRTLLRDLPSALSAALASGQLDPELFGAASAEVQTAATILDSDNGSGRAMIALKRFKGIVEGVSDLTVKVSAIIAALHGIG